MLRPPLLPAPFVLLLLLGCSPEVWCAQEKVPLKLELPRPLFVGTPVPVKVPNLESPRAGRRPDVLVPPDTVLLSRGRPVTSSETEPLIGDLEYVTDGDKSGTDGSYVELGPGGQWVQIDLGAPAALEAVVVWHFHAQARVYHQVVVQVSNDPEFKNDVSTVFNNDQDNLLGLGVGTDRAYVESFEGRLIQPVGAVARYLRLHSNGSTSSELNHYVEVEVWGRRVGNTPPASPEG